MQVKRIQTVLMRPGLRLGVFLVLLLTISGHAAMTSAGSFARAWTLATTHQPERYVSLYFAKPAQLPSYAPAGKTERVPFTIANHDGSTETFRYSVEFTTSGIEKVQYGSVTLADGQSVQEVATFLMPSANQSGQLIIQLFDPSERLTLRSRS